MHILVVGGSGMLAQACRALAEKGNTVSVIGRNKRKLDLLQPLSDKEVINPISCNYKDEKESLAQIKQACKKFGPIELSICWIHEDALEAPFWVAQMQNAQNLKSHYYHVLSSEEGNPARKRDKSEDKFASYENIRYHKVILGFVCEKNSSRWLTNEEISQGVLNAIELDSAQFVVGTVTPWNRRP